MGVELREIVDELELGRGHTHVVLAVNWAVSYHD